MHYFALPKNKALKGWIMDNQVFMDAYHAAARDRTLKAEIERLEIKYIRQHLVDLVGEDEADRIIQERGF